MYLLPCNFRTKLQTFLKFGVVYMRKLQTMSKG
jgi:hypothetical protein